MPNCEHYADDRNREPHDQQTGSLAGVFLRLKEIYRHGRRRGCSN
ncbi:MAG: hypothetical protein NTV46_08530 [Verrucomicrobia bacterium]|nr:hypothetical protein [Verrucomicrobiota bacterium]